MTQETKQILDPMNFKSFVQGVKNALNIEQAILDNIYEYIRQAQKSLDAQIITLISSVVSNSEDMEEWEIYATFREWVVKNEKPHEDFFNRYNKLSYMQECLREFNTIFCYLTIPDESWNI